MEREKILDKIRKLLALAKSDNPHEAANAAGRAQALIARYQLDPDECEVSGGPIPLTVGKHVIYMGRTTRHDSWAVDIAASVARVNRMHPYRTWDPSTRMPMVMAVGDHRDAELCKFLTGWLVGEVERLYLEAKPAGLGRGEGKAWANSFRLGAANTIGKRLRDAQDEERKKLMAGPSVDEYALATNSEAFLELDRRKSLLPSLLKRDGEHALAVSKVIEDMKLRAGARRYVSNGNGYAEGLRAGKRAHLSGRGLPGGI